MAQRIARADSSDVRLHFSGTNCSNCGSQGWAYNIPVPRNTIRAGDKIAWRQFQYGPAVPRGGVGLLFSDGTYSNWVTLDQDHQVMNDDTIQNAWHYRVVDLSQYAGKTVAAAWIDEDAHSGAGNWEEFFADISYFRADGTVQPVFNRQTAVAYPSFGSSGVSNQALEVNVSNQSGDAVQFLNTTTYFMGDHLGTAQMEFAGAGWPMWKGDFAPYGQEIGPQQTINNYKFTGLERDPETGLDHTQFRQLSSFQGRWMSPDPYDGSMDLGNPQSFNRYAYVGNNPLGFIDPSGLDRDGLGGIQLGFGCIGAAASGGGNVAADIGCGLNTLLHLLNLFHRPVFRGTLQPHPNGQIWDEHGSYKPKPYSSAAEILGLGQAGCEFGACGGGFQQSYTPGQDASTPMTLKQSLYELLLGVDRFDPNGRLFGTHYCGVGGAGQTTGGLDRACSRHDWCYAVSGVTYADNFSLLLSFSKSQALGGCNQALCDQTAQMSGEGPTRVRQFFTYGGGGFYGCSKRE